jgi:peptidoglycan/xylan/chitin deacetylase (PgdA/CDA1 family)
MLEVATSCLLALVRRARGGGVIINEHTLTAEQTRRHVEVLARWFDFIHLDELPRRLRTPGRRPFCLLTFDDGKRSHFTHVAPELERHRIPAVFNVTTDPLSDGRCFWFDRRNRLVKALGYCPAGLEVNSLKQLTFAELTEQLDRACDQWGLPPAAEDGVDDAKPLSWDEARDMHRRGFTFGAHGRTHAILTRESKMTAFAEIEESLARVSSELASRCHTFAFPNGNHDAELTKHAVRCGATHVMTTEPMWTDAATSLARLPRIQLFGDFSRPRIELKLALAAVSGALANPDGTGRAYWFVNGRKN